MSEQEYQALERYILSEAKDQALQGFPSNSSNKDFLELLAQLRLGNFTGVGPLLEKLEKANVSKAQVVKLRKLILELSAAQNPQERTQLTKQLNDEYLNCRWDFRAPEAIQREKQSDYPSSLSQDFTKDFESAHTKLNEFHKLTAEGIEKLDPLKLSDECLTKYIQKKLVNVPNYAARIANYLNSGKNLDCSVYRTMTLSQLKELENLCERVVYDKTFIRNKLEKEHQLDSMEDSQKYELLKVIWKQLENLPKTIDNLKCDFLRSILNLGTQLGTYEEEFFLKYLDLHPPYETLYSSKSVIENYKYSGLSLTADISSANEDSLLKNFLSHFFAQRDTIEPYHNYIKKEFLDKLFAETKVLQGADPSEFPVLNPGTLKGLKETVEVEPAPTNQKFFARDEEVTVTMDIKNVPKLLIRVLELNTYSYYKNFMKPIEPNINIDGLVPQKEIQVEYTQSSFVRHQEVFRFDELKAGAFVIEFIGNGRYSRVIVKKGTLKFVSKLTVSGHLFMVLDENNQVCKGPGSGLYLDGRFYSTHNENGIVMVPYCVESRYKNLVVTDGVISELCSGFEHLSENYTLETAFLVHEEQLLVGNPTTIGIKPKLFLNGVPAPSSLLVNPSAEIISTNDEGTSSSKTFSNLPSTEMIPLAFEVPPRLKEVQVIFKAQITYKTKGEHLNLFSKHQIPVNFESDEMRLFNIYLKKSEGYELHLKGKNGEPIPNTPLGVTLDLVDWNSQHRATLSSDQEGVINLGPLKGVSKVVTDIKPFGWNLDDLKPFVQYPSVLELCEGDQFELPIYRESEDNLISDVNFFSVKENLVLDQKMDCLEYNPETSMLRLSNLEKGTYILVIKHKKQSTIRVNVREGTHWANNSFILSENSVVPTPMQYRSLLISSAQVEADSIKAKLSGDFDSTVVHTLLFNYLSSTYSELISSLRSVFPEQFSGEQTFEKPQSLYLKSAFLDEEYRYVLERRHQKRVPGNTLDKPQLVLKRLLEGDSKTESKKAKKGERMDRMYSKQCMAREADPFRRLGREMPGITKYKAGSDFLENSGKWIWGVEVTREGTVTIQDDQLQSYSHALVVAYNNESLSSRIVDLPGKTTYREMRVMETLDPQKGFCEERKSTSVLEGQVFCIKDCTSANFEMVDSLEKLYKLQVELLRTANKSLNYSEWKFLGDWEDLEPEKKSELYDKYFSHELNFFLYMKDPQFFEATVKPFLACKLEKTFVDKYLIGDSLSEYFNFVEACKLNTLEKLMLLEKAKQSNSQFAESLSKSIQNLSDSVVVSEEARNKMFDSVLTFNIINNEPRAPPPNAPASAGLFGAGQISNQLMEVKGVSGTFGSAKAKKKSFRKMESDDMEMDSEEESMPVPHYYQKMESTKVFTETNYYKSGGFIEDKNPFWGQVAKAIMEGTQVLSESVLLANSSLPELVAGLAFTNLPFKAKDHFYKPMGLGIEITAASNFIGFHKEVKETQTNINPQILVAQHYSDPSDPFLSEEDSFKTKEITSFLHRKIYQCKLVITNTSGALARVNVLAEVPQGSVPINPKNRSKTYVLRIDSFQTSVVEYSFYFPYPGTFQHFPANVSSQGVVVAKPQLKLLEVKDSFQITSFESFSDFVAGNQKSMILDFLRTENLYKREKGFEISMIYHILKDQEFWEQVMEILVARFFFDFETYSFALYHSNEKYLGLFLENSFLKGKVGPYFSSKYLNSPRNDYKHLEFHPIVNARAHQLANYDRITNLRFKQVYKDFLEHLAYKTHLDLEDKLCLVQYWIYQDRIPEALELYNSLEMSHSTEAPGSSTCQIQFDYLSCYLDLEKARVICPLYENYPVPTWKKYFQEVSKLLKEVEGEQLQDVSVPSSVEPTLDFEVSEGLIKLHYQNVKSCTVKLYTVDLEVLFSKNPSFLSGMQNFSFVKPSFEFSVTIVNETNQEVNIPEEFKFKNMLIEVDYGSYSSTHSYFATSLKVNVVERYGQVRVTNSGKPLAGAYVKAFASFYSGSTEFYKDGYTDLRGKFDYVSLNQDLLNSVAKFHLLVVHEEFGSTVNEANPPPQ